MSSQESNATGTPPSGELQKRSDDRLSALLGRDLQAATLRGTLYLVIAAAVLATIGVFVR